jgi:sugar/nucleoside kinase (ribokinase family)
MGMKIIGIGNALLDVLLRLDSDDVLSGLGVKKGAMDLVDEPAMRAIQQAQAGLPRSEFPGGSAGNTMRAMAKLGAEAGFIGKTGADEAGRIYEARTGETGVKPFFVRAEGASGRSTVLISPDGERTMATFLGLAATLSDDEIPDALLQRYDCLYAEGYLIANPNLFLPLLKRAKRMGLKIALDLSNFNIVNGFRDVLKETIPACVDILFSNESEAEAYTGLGAREALDVLSKDVETAVVTMGKDGALAASGGKVVHEKALNRHVVDTTGAGDHFAAGFLYGYSTGATTEQSARLGSLLSANVIDVVGARIPEERWEQIKLKVNGILRR